MLGLLKLLFRDTRSRQPAPHPAVRAEPPPPPRERTAADAIADAEERMKRLPPDRAQLIRQAMAIHRATRETTFANLSDEERAKLQHIAEKTFLGGGGKG
jgi:hypothetical protein